MNVDESGSITRIKQTRLPYVRAYYMAGLFIGLVLLSFNFYSAITLIEAQGGSAILINTSGRQRMLSQRIALLSLTMINDIRDDNESLESDKFELQSLIDEMWKSHTDLLNGKIGDFYFIISKKIDDMYKEKPYDINYKLDQYLKEAHLIANFKGNVITDTAINSINYITNTSGSLVKDLDAVVMQYDAEYSQQIDGLKRNQVILFFVLISAVALEGLFIFYPMEKKITERENDLIEQIKIRREAQTKLSQSEYAYRLLASNLPDLSVLLFDRNLRYILADGPFLELSGYNKLAIEGRTLEEVIKDPEIYSLFKQYYNAALNGEKTSFERLSQRGFYYQTQIVPTYDQNGSITGGMAVTRNITQHKKDEEKLQESESRFRQLVNSLKSIFWLASSDASQVFYLSHGFEEFYGKTADELLNDPKSFSENIHPDDLEIVNKDRLTRIYNNQYDVEYRVVIDGEIRWMWSRAFAIRNSDGEVVRTSGVIEDITAKKEFERKTFQLEIEKKTIKLLSNFIRDTAHDLRTPLTIIGTSSYLLRKISDADEQIKHIEMINKQVDRLKIIIEQLHSMSHMDGLTTFSENKVNVSDILKNVYRQITQKARAKNIEIDLVLGENSYYINGDENYLFKAIYNICDNAIIYTNDGGRIRLEIHIDGNDVIVEIRDSGIGISQENIDKIFQRFYKVNEARTSNNSGSGLGLTMSKMIIERHSGRITVDSELGYGSTFKIYLPINQNKRAD